MQLDHSGRQGEASGEPSHPLFSFLLGQALRLADGSHDEVLEQTDVGRIHDRRVDRDLLEFAVAVGDRAYHPTSRSGLHAFRLQLLLQPGHVLLQLLDLFHHLAKVTQSTTPLRISDCGLRIGNFVRNNPRSAMRNPKFHSSGLTSRIWAPKSSAAFVTSGSPSAVTAGSTAGEGPS